MDSKKRLLTFMESSNAFDNSSKLKLILLLSGVKPSTYARIRTQKNLHDKHEFEELLKENGILFDVSSAKGYEEIVKVQGNAAVWRLRGIWHGYDLFKNKNFNARFLEYVTLLRQKKHETADQLAGIIYGYPQCCINTFIKGHAPTQLAKKYTSYQYYKRLHDMDKKFPFIAHTPCSLNCKETKKLNALYTKAVKKNAPAFYKEYSKKRTYSAPLIVDVESDTIQWKKKDGHEYSLVTQKPIEGKYYLISWLSKKEYKRGTILDAKITLQYDYAIVNAKKTTGHLANFHHERKFTRP